MRGEVPTITTNFDRYVEAAFNQWREDQALVANAILQELPTRLDMRGLVCKTHRTSARVQGPIEGGGYRIDACCNNFLSEIVNIFSAQVEAEEQRAKRKPPKSPAG